MVRRNARTYTMCRTVISSDDEEQIGVFLICIFCDSGSRGTFQMINNYEVESLLDLTRAKHNPNHQEKSITLLHFFR